MNPRYIFAVSSHLLLYKVASATDSFVFGSLTLLFFLVFVVFGSSQFELSILSFSLPQALSIPCTSSSLLSYPEMILLASAELPVSLTRKFRSTGTSSPWPELPVVLPVLYKVGPGGKRDLLTFFPQDPSSIWSAAGQDLSTRVLRPLRLQPLLRRSAPWDPSPPRSPAMDSGICPQLPPLMET